MSWHDCGKETNTRREVIEDQLTFALVKSYPFRVLALCYDRHKWPLVDQLFYPVHILKYWILNGQGVRGDNEATKKSISWQDPFVQIHGRAGELRC